MAVCIDMLRIAARDLEGSFPSQRIAFKDLINIYIDPRANGKLVRSTINESRTGGLDRPSVQLSSPTGEGMSFRILYHVGDDKRPTNIYIQHRNTAYDNNGKRSG